MPKNFMGADIFCKFSLFIIAFFGDLRGNFDKRKTRFVDKFAV